MANTTEPEKKRKNYTKTASGMRTIDIPQDLVQLLKWWKKQQYDNLCILQNRSTQLCNIIIHSCVMKKAIV